MGTLTSFNVLIFNVGRRGELIECFRKAGEKIGLHIKIIGCDISPFAPAFVLCDHKERISPGRTKKTERELINLVKRYNINLVVPTMDFDFEFLDNLRERLRELGAFLLLPPRKAIRIVNNKRVLTNFLLQHGINAPRLIDPEKLRRKDFPVFVKPAEGWGSRNAKKVESPETLKFLLDNYKDLIVTEYIEGEEYTIDCYRSFSGKWMKSCPRVRHRTRGGEILVGTFKNQKLFKEICNKIGMLLDLKGPFCIQAFLTETKKIYVFEINTRFCGGMPISIMAGMPIIEWLLTELVYGPLHTPPQFKYPEGQFFVRMDRSFLCEKPW